VGSPARCQVQRCARTPVYCNIRLFAFFGISARADRLDIREGSNESTGHFALAESPLADALADSPAAGARARATVRHPSLQRNGNPCVPWRIQ
jgi:hypothetical protein